MKFNTISVVGLGYIGLPTAAVIASRQQKVVGVDVNEKVVETINQGRIHIAEPDLNMIVHAAVSEGYLTATTQAQPADAFLIAVPTPFINSPGNTSHKPDLSYIQAASEAIAPVLAPGNLVILESTSPVGATEKMAEWLARARPDLSFPQNEGENSDIRIAHCPERVLPGQVIRELVENARVIGGMTKACTQAACDLYRIFVKGECIGTTARTAEMTKLTENSFRDVNIAFANELSTICHQLDIDVWELIRLANRHPRVNILQPGAGVGGHCIAVDPWFIIGSCPERAKVIRTAREVNDDKPGWVLQQVEQALEQVQAGDPDRPPESIAVACFGISFKPDIDDLRESPALDIAARLSHLGYRLFIVEPHIDELPEVLNQPHVQSASMEEALAQADVVCILVRHRTFAERVESLRSHRRVVDAVGLLS